MNDQAADDDRPQLRTMPSMTCAAIENWPDKKDAPKERS
jgi:hypothetical protein